MCLLLQVLRDILKEVQGNMVPRSMLKEWALHTLPNATDYWTFRKMFTIQLALIGLAEFMLHLNRLNPEMLQIAQVRDAPNVSHRPSRTQGILVTGGNSIAPHANGSIKRSPSASLAAWLTFSVTFMLVLSVKLPSSMQRMFWQNIIFSPSVLQLSEAHTRTHTHQNGAQDLQTAFSKSLLKMIVSISQTAPLILIGLCWQAFLWAAKQWY